MLFRDSFLTEGASNIFVVKDEVFLAPPKSLISSFPGITLTDATELAGSERHAAQGAQGERARDSDR